MIISTGTSLDILLPDKGYSPGRLYHIYGRSKSGKSILGIEAIRQTNLLDKCSIFIDTQNSLSDYYIKSTDFFALQLTDQQDVIKNCLELIEDSDLIVLDSLEVFDSSKLCKDFLRKMALKCRRLNKTFIYTNQIREAVYNRNSKGVSPRYKDAVYRYSDYNIFLKRTSKIKRVNDLGIKIQFELEETGAIIEQKFMTGTGFE